MSARNGVVFLVGAGPGARGLMTLRGAELMGSADVVVYDSLVNPELLNLAPPGAETILAGKRGGTQPGFTQKELNRLLIERARAGMRVVRLKGGDPFIFGRGGEEAEALAASGVRFEVVPGVTSAIAAPAFAGIPLTHRDYGSFVVFITAHEDPAKSPQGASTVPWEELAAAARGNGTLVLLMAAATMEPALARLVAAGMDGATPAAAIQSGTTAAQKTACATLATLAKEAERIQIGAPALVVVGGCAALRNQLKWFELMPLFGRRIVVTRARAGAAEFAAGLRALGAEAIEFPVIETAPPQSFTVLDEALARPHSFDWIIFTSATAVEAFVERLRELDRDLRDLNRAAIAAIGPATAARLRRYALKAAAIPKEYRSEAIAGAIGARRIRGASFLIPRAEQAREALPRILREQGAREVVVAPAYRTVRPNTNPEPIQALIRARAIDLVTFTSSSTVENFCAIAGAPVNGLKAGAIGPITAERARDRGFEVVVAPPDYTVPALIAAIAEHFQAAAARG